MQRYRAISQKVLSLTIKLLSAPIAMDWGLRFGICEGGRASGLGVIAKIIE